MSYKYLNITNMSFVKEYVQKRTSKNVFSPSKYFSRLVTHRKELSQKAVKVGLCRKGMGILP